MMNKTAKFNIGDCVRHKIRGYRAIIVDIDPIFQASGHYNPQAHKRAFAIKNPWYRLLIDNSGQMTYVEEPMLLSDEDPHPINNPNLPAYLNRVQGKYILAHTRH